VPSKRRRRDADLSYTITLREVFGGAGAAGTVQVTAVDARRCGNVARFANHSCAPNLRVQAQRRGRLRRPVPVLVAARDVFPGEELCFDYSQDDAGGAAPLSNTRCACGAAACRGFLPR